MGSRFSKNRNASKQADASSSTTDLLTKEKEKDWQVPPPSPPTSAPPVIAPPAYEDKPEEPVAPQKTSEPADKAPAWLHKFVYTYSGTITITCSDGKKLTASGLDLEASSPVLQDMLTFRSKEDPIYEIKLTDKDSETHAIMSLYVTLLQGKDLPLPSGTMPFQLWHLGNLLRMHQAHKQKVILGLIISNWLSKAETRDLVESPPMMFLVGDILQRPTVCADVLRAYANRTLRRSPNKGESVWDLEYWSQQNVECCSEKYRNALRNAFAECRKGPDGPIDADRLVKGFENSIGAQELANHHALTLIWLGGVADWLSLLA
ncbi:hypothetical protein I317_02838 [Kwoniella heveanensis CBS 569]|uniref:BTB domain-containing protein n=1 Tax=Kwoniella heveanensis BCC8398 TaxID=1296120 RepID=A0A1B9GRK8_9TREE|nr:hypothetical protein I316_04730 [Kwoniella heveanensis BCC8398]OCF43270.1 hypothetical protein I317_02838 [Kwoniella heveanensis CBS 569]